MTSTPLAITTVALEGEIDIDNLTSPRLILLGALAAAAGSTLVVEMSRVTFLDSAGLALLVVARNWALEAGGALRLIRPTWGVRRALEASGLDRLLVEDDDILSAAALIRRATGQ